VSVWERVARYLRVEVSDGEPSAQSISAEMRMTSLPQGDTQLRSRRLAIKAVENLAHAVRGR
jgi:hypothetical protein